MKKAYIVGALSVMSAYLLATEIAVEPGKLYSLMANNHNATALTLTGDMDVRDFKFINDSLKSLTSIDMSGVNIQNFANDTAYFGEQLNYPANELPQLCFFNSGVSTVVLPASLVAIGEGAFSNCVKLESINFNENLDSIGDFAFYDCDTLTSITIPSNLKKIGKYTFAKCNNLASATINISNFAVPDYAFSNCTALASVTLPESTVSIGKGSFEGNSALISFTFPQGLQVISDEAFNGAPIASLDLSNCSKLDSIGAWVFGNNKALTTVKFPNGLSKIGNGAFFMTTALEHIALPESVNQINDFVFTGSEKVNIQDIVPPSTTHIGKYAFADWTAMLEYQLPESLESIDDNAFQNNTSLQKIEIHTTSVPQLGNDVFKGIDQPNVKLLVEDNMVSPFENADQWQAFDISTISSTTSPEIANSIKAYFNGTLLTVEAPNAIAETMLYDVKGRELTRNNTNNNIITIETANFDGNIYILAGKLADGNKFSLKLVRK